MRAGTLKYELWSNSGSVLRHLFRGGKSNPSLSHHHVASSLEVSAPPAHTPQKRQRSPVTIDLTACSRSHLFLLAARHSPFDQTGISGAILCVSTPVLLTCEVLFIQPTAQLPGPAAAHPHRRSPAQPHSLARDHPSSPTIHFPPHSLCPVCKCQARQLIFFLTKISFKNYTIVILVDWK